MVTAGEAAGAAMDDILAAVARRTHDDATAMMDGLVPVDAAPEFAGAVMAGMASAVLTAMWNRREGGMDAAAIMGAWVKAGCDFHAHLQRTETSRAELDAAKASGLLPKDTPLFQERASVADAAVGVMVASLCDGWSHADAAASEDGETIVAELAVHPALSGGVHALAALAWDWSPDHMTAESVAYAFKNAALIELTICAEQRPAGGGFRGEAPLATL